jgi:excinuclease ABC subunit C
VKGLGPKRRAAVVERFGRLWDARQASEEELAALPGLNRSVAQALHRALR